MPPFDPLPNYDIVSDDIEQRRVTGHDVTVVRTALDALPADDDEGLRALYGDGGAFVASGPRDAIVRSLAHVPPGSRPAAAIRDVLSARDAGLAWDDALARIQEGYGHYNWVHTVSNAAVITCGLLWGDGDPLRSIGLTVQAGWDTDANGATVGSVVGVLAGMAGLPAHLIDPLDDGTRSALFGFDNSRISELAARTAALALRPMPEPALGW